MARALAGLTPRSAALVNRGRARAGAVGLLDFRDGLPVLALAVPVSGRSARRRGGVRALRPIAGGGRCGQPGRVPRSAYGGDAQPLSLHFGPPDGAPAGALCLTAGVWPGDARR